MTIIILQYAPQLHPDTEGAHPTRRDKGRDPPRQTAAEPYGGGGVQRDGDYRYDIHTTYTNTTWSQVANIQ